MAEIPRAYLQYIINHVVLPPRLPDKAEDTQMIRLGEQHLIKLLSNTVSIYRQQNTDDSKISKSWEVVEKMLTNCASLGSAPSLTTDNLVQAFENLEDPSLLLLHLRAQNAALLLRKSDATVVFECFEASSDAASVFETKASLLRRFPAHAVSMPLSTFDDALFRCELAHRLVQLDVEDVEEMRPQSQKAKKKMGEIRDTAHPGLVTEMLMATLASLGMPVNVRQIQKRIRDDVLWRDCLLPWRRSAFWLTLRIAIQTTLRPKSQSKIEYKNFLVFLLSEIAWKASVINLSEETCHIIITKISRRIFKLGAAVKEFVRNRALDVCCALAAKLDVKWQGIQDQDADRPTTIERRPFECDTSLSLHSSKEYLESVLSPDRDTLRTQISFNPSCSAGFRIYLGFPDLGNLGSSKREETIFALTEFELWISESLTAWKRTQFGRAPDCIALYCMALAELARGYYALASPLYEHSPEQISTMLLVLAELWLALDELAITVTPLLAQYPPAIPSDMFEPLLLPKLSQMQRLRIVELYISARGQAANPENPAIFTDPAQNSFAVRYFASSPHHQALRKRITEDADRERGLKEAEWRKLNEEHQRLRDEADRMSCEYTEKRYNRSVHSVTCEKCDLDRRANSMTIDVFEWPLPKDEIFCASIIVELDCPLTIVAWRNLTWMLIHDIGREGGSNGDDPAACLDSYGGLQIYMQHRSSRLTMASTTKPFVKSHYCHVYFPADLKRCFTDNALHYKLFDPLTDSWITEQIEGPEVHSMCITTLPKGPYSNLQYAVDATGHFQNGVIADQAICSNTLSLHEFLSFGSLRADGERTQWSNIKRELGAANLRFKTEAVVTLLTQTMWQAGSRENSDHRTSHVDLMNSDFSEELLNNVTRILASIEANWMSDNAMQLLIIVVLRTLSLCLDKNVINIAMNLLKSLRSVSLRWTRYLENVLHDTVQPEEISKLQQRLLKVSLLCKMTFDVDKQFMAEAMDSADGIRSWIICSMHVRDNCPGDEALLPQDTRRLLMRDTKLTCAYYRLVRNLIIECQSPGLDQAISHIWSGFKRGSSPWTVLDDLKDRWVTAETFQASGRKPQRVHYNILEGELLVDGKPLGRLQTEMVRSSFYLRLLGSQILRVCTADIPGMLYMSAQEVKGYYLYFGMRGKELVVRARKGAYILEYVPSYRFNDDFPAPFVDDHIHWLDIASGKIEFRPFEQRWESKAENWCLTYSPESTSWLASGDLKLIDIRSQTFAAVLNVFRPLENSKYIHVTLSKDSRLEVVLPRYDLRFYFNPESCFECHELRKIIDPNQSVGTLIGLQNRLVMCDIKPLARKHDRVLVIPEGEISILKNDFFKCPHVKVRVSIDGRRVRLFRYQIDSTLNRLQGESGILGTLYKAYLHAITSHILPDRLTGRTGTEEALSCLRQQSLSFTKLPSGKEAHLLTLMSELTPRREFYPQHKKVMQQVEWKADLSPLVQHDEFFPLAERILMSGNPYSIFYPELYDKPSLSLRKKHDDFLLSRARIRNACFRSRDFGGDVDLSNQDKAYQARDHPEVIPRGIRSFTTASLVRNWPQVFQVSSTLQADLHTYGTLSGFGVVYDTSQPLSELLDVKFSNSWGSLYELCRIASRQRDTYRLLFLFSIIAFGGKITSLTTLSTLLAFAFVEKLREPALSKLYTFFALGKGYTIDSEAILKILNKEMPRYNGPGSKKHRALWQAKNDEHQEENDRQTRAVLAEYTNQWPCSTPVRPPRHLSDRLRWNSASADIERLFWMWTANGNLRNFIEQVQTILDLANGGVLSSDYEPAKWHLRREPQPRQTRFHLPALADLVTEITPGLTPGLSIWKVGRHQQSTEKNKTLYSLIEGLRIKPGGSDDHNVRIQYHDDLLASCDSFTKHQEQINPPEMPYLAENAVLHRIECEYTKSEALSKICSALIPSDSTSRLLQLSGLWPRITLSSLLPLISSKSRVSLTASWKACLLSLGQAVTLLQRARRLVLAAERLDISAFCIELENEGHQDWKPEQWPDWLLIEIEGDFLIRPTQARVALEMINPTSSSNSLIQLNMGKFLVIRYRIESNRLTSILGEGKSSVIIPLVAVAIADSSRLSRVVVLKSLAKQMSDTISQRLGGLVDRRIYFMPFSRRVHIDESVALKVQAMYNACCKDRGVLLTQPEHILSFKLMGIERLTSGDHKIASAFIKSQRWLEANSRDILDESDELLDVKFQLIYTLGNQRMMDGQPDRWLTIQNIFDLVEERALDVYDTSAKDIEIKYRKRSSFPFIRIFTRQAADALLSQVARDIIHSRLSDLNLEPYASYAKAAFYRFIMERKVSELDCKVVAEHFGEHEKLMKQLLLIRGLFAYEILIFVMRSKRWSVNFGLHPSRCLLAVPYRAKGVPAPSAEFGHPDVAIALTCLSYYYTGLTNLQIRECLELLQKVDDSSLEYTAWIKKCDELPENLRDWNAVNLEDSRQCHEDLFPSLKYSKKVIDFYTANVVFPKEGKEFDEKLSTSGWDLIQNGNQLTTGFSGTNDNRFVLPLSISQQDLPELQHTSGKVLNYVLEENNLMYRCARDEHGRQLSAKGLIQFFSRADASIKVLIDVGAQVLDTLNRDFVKAWMDVAPDVDAGVFFDEDDNVMVLTRSSKLEKLSVSSFQSRMDRCVVYLDEVHTRGTDLKLPWNVRAAVTLGPRLTKDRLVQACMRLRKLAQGQTLMFLAPPEVHRDIIELTGKNEDSLDGYDVIAWSLEQSCLSIERSQPLRILQGLDYKHRLGVMDRFSRQYPDFEQINLSSESVTAFRDKERQKLNDLYAPLILKTNRIPSVIESSRDSSDEVVKHLLAMWEVVDSTVCDGASMNEEHEREVAHEVEQETQVERPPKVSPQIPAVDPRLQAYVSSGSLALFHHQFSSLSTSVTKGTTVKFPDNIGPWSHLKATSDFARVLKNAVFGYTDNYLRPVNWILTSKHDPEAKYFLLISQFEANRYLREIQHPSSGVKLHIYEPKVTKSQVPVDFGVQSETRSVKEWQALDSRSRRELHLFAGQLYFNTYEDYKAMTDELGSNSSPDKTISSIHAWIAIRRKGQSFLQTHVGHMVSGRVLQESAFE